MSRRSLARTVIEGGRCGHYKAERDARIQEERAASRVFLHRLCLDPEAWDDGAEAPRRTHVAACFADRLGPIYRFLDSRVGRPWSAVRSELFQKFDSRTTPGRHVLHDHLLRDVCESSEPDAVAARYKSYAVDAEGRLTKNAPPPWKRHWKSASRPRPNYAAIAVWLAGRKVGRPGGGSRLFWFVPTSNPSRITSKATKRSDGIEYIWKDVCGGEIVASWLSFRQDAALGPRDEGIFLALPADVQEKLLAMAPVARIASPAPR
jgi:hypothetical protein